MPITVRSEIIRSPAMRGSRIVVVGLLVSAWIFCAWSPSANAVTAWPGVTEVSQPDGTRFGLRLKGDEFFSWHETAEGYAVALDARDGVWKYARPSAAKAAFEVLPEAAVGKADPKALGLRRGELPPAGAIRRHMESGGRQQRRGLEDSLASGPASQPSLAQAVEEETGLEPPPQAIPVSGTKTIRNIVILACFNDHWNAGAGTAMPVMDVRLLRNMSTCLTGRPHDRPRRGLGSRLLHAGFLQ